VIARKIPKKTVPTPDQRIYVDALKELGVTVFLDDLESGWDGKVGLIRSLLGRTVFAPVDSVFAIDIPLKDESLELVGALSSVKSIYIENAQITDEGLSHLRDLPCLERLHLPGCRITDSGVTFLASCVKLRYLDLSKTLVGEEDICWLARLLHLEEVWLEHTNAPDQNVLALLQVRPQLTIHWFREDEKPAVRKLCEAGARIQSDENGYAKEVVLWSDSVRDDDLQWLKHLVKLKILSVLCNHQVTDKSFEYITGLLRLTSLYLVNTAITDFGIRSLLQLKALRELDLRGSYITDDSLIILKNMTNLRELDLSNTKVTRSGILQLQEVLTECAITI
jgi:internalin A